MDENHHPDQSRKTEIRAEEIYRRAVVDELEKAREPKTLSGKATKFFQTSFGGFIASSLLLPLCLWVYATTQSHYENLEAKSKLVSKLDAELSLRIRLTSGYLCDGAIDKFVHEFSNSPSAYREFRGVNTLGLLTLLAVNLPEADRIPVNNALDALTIPTKDGLVAALQTRSWSKRVCPVSKP